MNKIATLAIALLAFTASAQAADEEKQNPEMQTVQAASMPVGSGSSAYDSSITGEAGVWLVTVPCPHPTNRAEIVVKVGHKTIFTASAAVNETKPNSGAYQAEVAVYLPMPSTRYKVLLRQKTDDGDGLHTGGIVVTTAPAKKKDSD